MEEFHLNSGCTTNIVDQLLVSNNLLGMGKDGLGQKPTRDPSPPLNGKSGGSFMKGVGPFMLQWKKGWTSWKNWEDWFFVGWEWGGFRTFGDTPPKTKMSREKNRLKMYFFHKTSITVDMLFIFHRCHVSFREGTSISFPAHKFSPGVSSHHLLQGQRWWHQRLWEHHRWSWKRRCHLSVDPGIKNSPFMGIVISYCMDACNQ